MFFDCVIETMTKITVGKPFDTKIGVGRVIRGWDEGVPQLSLGEKARLTITGYVPTGFSNPSFWFSNE
jgi:FKBP-type peptidyl-prolyl cis-trans isomerase